MEFQRKPWPLAALAVGSAVVDLHGEDVLGAAEADAVGDVQAVAGHAVLIQPDLLAVKVEDARLAHALELEEELVAGEFQRGA